MRRLPLLSGFLSPLTSLAFVATSYGYPFQNVLLSDPAGSRGAVSSESAICSQIGIDLLKQGGNAADAMVGTIMCVGVIGMYHSGIGGGGFMLVRDDQGKYESIAYREKAPAAAFQDMFKDNVNASIYGGLAAGVPGELRGLDYVHKKYGVLSWKSVVMPSVLVARDGFVVTEDLVRYMAAATVNYNFLVEDITWAQDFAPNRTLLKLGDTITRKRYADSLQKIAEQGVDVFYDGELGQSFINTVRARDGTMTMEDLKNYNISAKPALGIDYRGYRVFATDAPSSGAVTLNILNTIAQYPLEDMTDVNLRTHRFDEAMRFAYGARQNLGDPDFVRNIEEYEGRMLSVCTGRKIRSHIHDNETQPVSAYDPSAIYSVDSFGTSHIVTADSSGMTLTTTTTINLLFGSQLMTHDTGIILNNEMNDFSIPGVRNAFGYEPSPNNFVAAGKRPLSSITPIIVEHPNGTVLLATGAAGGSRIVSATAQVVWHVLDHEMSMHGAIAQPRFHDQLMPNVTTFEYDFDNSTVRSMKEKGHDVTWVAPGLSAVHGIRRLWNGTFEAASETRQKNSGGLSL